MKTITTVEKQNEERDKIIAGLALAYERVKEYKRYKKTPLVLMQNGKIVHIKP
ncbi:MAG: hypothetical protein K2Q03_00960 [Sphingobacteriaceae bacterium]|nr:hypothetical protein [Sphingobacteriaceae bacterium]